MPISRDDVFKTILLINANYPNNKYEASKMMVDTWESCLGHYDYDTLLLAVQRTIATCKYPPTIANINEAVKELVLLGIPLAGEAWETLRREVKEGNEVDCYVAYKRTPTGIMVKQFDWHEDALAFAGTDGEIEISMRKSDFYTFIEKGSLLDRTVQALGGLGSFEFEDAKTEGIMRAKFFEVYNELRERTATLAITPQAVRQGAIYLANRQMQALPSAEERG